MTIKDIQTEVAEAVVAYTQANDPDARRVQNQRERTLAMAGPPNLKGMRRRAARTYAPSRRIKAVYRRSVRRGTISLKAWLKLGAVPQDAAQEWRSNKSRKGKAGK